MHTPLYDLGSTVRSRLKDSIVLSNAPATRDTAHDSLSLARHTTNT